MHMTKIALRCCHYCCYSSVLRVSLKKSYFNRTAVFYRLYYAASIPEWRRVIQKTMYTHSFKEDVYFVAHPCQSRATFMLNKRSWVDQKKWSTKNVNLTSWCNNIFFLYIYLLRPLRPSGYWTNPPPFFSILRYFFLIHIFVVHSSST